MYFTVNEGQIAFLCASWIQRNMKKPNTACNIYINYTLASHRQRRSGSSPLSASKMRWHAPFQTLNLNPFPALMTSYDVDDEVLPICQTGVTERPARILTSYTLRRSQVPEDMNYLLAWFNLSSRHFWGGTSSAAQILRQAKVNCHSFHGWSQFNAYQCPTLYN